MQKRSLQPRDVAGAADLHKLPVLTKADLRAHADELTASNAAKMDIEWVRTGGTTGEPMRIAKDSLCSAWESMCMERGLEWGGLKVDERRITLFGGSLGIDRTRVTTRLGKLVRRDTFLPAFELRSDTAPTFFTVIRRSGARYLLGYASAIYRLAVLAANYAPDIRFAAVFPTSELLLPEWEETIRRQFQAEILPYYGCGEVNSLGFSVTAGGYLIPEEQCIIEVMSRDGSTALHGDGQFVITSLVNRAMPIVRYVNGDAGRIRAPSGSAPFDRIDQLEGRFNSFLMTDSGELISGVIGTHIFRHVARSVESYRIIQEEPLRIVIKVVPRGDLFSSNDEELIRNLLAKHLGSRMTISIERVPSLPQLASGKAVFVLNRLL